MKQVSKETAQLLLRREALRRIWIIMGKVKHFDIGTWGCPAEGTETDERNFCNTVCCVAGSAALDPWFQQFGIGLKFNTDFSTIWPINGKFRWNEHKSEPELIFQRAGLTVSDINALFYPTAYEEDVVKLHHVRRRIEELLFDGETPLLFRLTRGRFGLGQPKIEEEV